MWYAMRMFRGGANAPAKPGEPVSSVAPAFPKTAKYDMYAYINEQPEWRAYPPSDLVWQEEGVSWADADVRSRDIVYHPSPVRETGVARRPPGAVFTRGGGGRGESAGRAACGRRKLAAAAPPPLWTWPVLSSQQREKDIVDAVVTIGRARVSNQPPNTDNTDNTANTTHA